jgi:[ribosomal protein S5]-alanine N-acetyltransferase
MEEIVFRRGERVLLRPLERSDARALCVWNNDPETALGLNQLLPMSELDAQNWIASLSQGRSQIAFGIVTTDLMKLVGTTAIYGINWEHRTATTGTTIGDREYRHKGYATEAKRLVLAYAFESLDLQVIISRIALRNQAAVSCVVNCGYLEVGRIPKWYSCGGGERCDEVLFALTQDRWRSLGRVSPAGAGSQD